jgi:hypothetical protein
MPDTILEGEHPRIISAKFGWDWLSSFREDFFLNSIPLFPIFSMAAILVGSRDHRTQFWKRSIQGSFHQSLVAIGPVVSEEKICLCKFPIGSYVKLSSAVGAILVEGPNRRTHFWKRTIQWLFDQNLDLIEQMVSDKKFLREFPIGSYVKSSSAVVVGLKCRTQFWKGTTQESFQQSLVGIGSVVSEEKIFLKFHPPFFLICIIGQNQQKFKDHKKSRNIC